MILDTNLMSATDPANVKPLPKDAQKVFQGHNFSVWQWSQTMYDDSKATFERLARRDYAYIICVLPDKKIMLVEDEQPDRGSVLTGAGGGVEENETSSDAAARELLEETGYSSSDIVPWHSYRPTSRIDMLTHAFIGRDAKKVAQAKPEPGEKIKVVTFLFDEFLELGKNPHLRDWMLRIKLLEALVDNKKREELKELLYGHS